jgi:hypothetical protein
MRVAQNVRTTEAGPPGPVAASARPPPTGHPQGSPLEGAAPSAPVARRRPDPLEVGSPTPRECASRKTSRPRRRDRLVPSRPPRGHLQPGTRRVLPWRAPLRRRQFRVADRIRWRWGRRPRGECASHKTFGPRRRDRLVPPRPQRGHLQRGTRKVLPWRAPLRRRRFRVAGRIRWRWGRRPRGDARRTKRSDHGGGTAWSRRGLSEATSNGAPAGFSPGGRRSVGAGSASRDDWPHAPTSAPLR